MKIAINTSPLQTAHKYRGIGYYVNYLLDAFEKDSSLEIIRFNTQSQLKDVDCVHYPWFDFFFHTLPLKKRFPTVITIHDVIPLIFNKHYPIGIKSRINYFLQMIALKSCKHIITDSRSSKKDIVKYLKINEEKITAIPLAVDENFKVLSDIELLRFKMKYKLPDKFLLYVGDANWVKNLPFLIEGFRKLIQSKSLENLKLILVGGVFLKNVENIDHPELESLKRLNKIIKDYKLEGKILKVGNIGNDELVAYYNLATLYIQPSVYEGFGLPVLQALSCGTPVVSSRGGSLPEVGGEACAYFDPTDLNQFVSITQELLENAPLLNKLSVLGLKQASKFSWAKTAFLTKMVYEKAVK